MTGIDSVGVGEVKVDGKSYFSDAVVWWDGKVDYRPKAARFTLDDYVKLLKRGPEIIVLGGGRLKSFAVEPAVAEYCENREMELFIETSKKAAQMFNAFAEQGKKVVAVLRTA